MKTSVAPDWPRSERYRFREARAEVREAEVREAADWLRGQGIDAELSDSGVLQVWRTRVRRLEITATLTGMIDVCEYGTLAGLLSRVTLPRGEGALIRHLDEKLQEEAERKLLSAAAPDAPSQLGWHNLDEEAGLLAGLLGKAYLQSPTRPAPRYAHPKNAKP